MKGLIAFVVAVVAAVGVGAWSHAHGHHGHHHRLGGQVFAHHACKQVPLRNTPRLGRLVRVQFFSRALGRRDAYLVYVPPGYDAAVRRGARFPVFYALHGDTSGAEHLVRYYHLAIAMDGLVGARQVRPFLVVMPEGCDGTRASDHEWADTGHGRYASYLLDLVRAVDARWATVLRREGRALAGLSMGGYGAINVGLRHLDLFSILESWSGYFRQTPTGPFRHSSQALLNANSPVHYVGRLRGQLRRHPVHAFLYGGLGDPYTLQLEPFAHELRAAGATVVAAALPGAHGGALWQRQMPAALRFADRWFGARR